MKTEQIVTYSLKMFDPLCGAIELFSGIKNKESLDTLLSGYTFGNVTPGTKMTLTKTVNTIDMDAQRVLSKYDDSHFDFYITKKLPYAKDIRDILVSKYGNAGDFNPNVDQLKHPLLITGVTHHTRIGLRLNLLSPATRINVTRVSWRVMNNSDIVVDNNFKQLWPPQSDTFSSELAKFINQKTL